MPTYEYRCGSCGHEFELFQSMKDAPKRKCPKCEKNALERLIGTGAAVLFKGSGFYETDYRSESYKKAREAESKAAEPAKSESKSGENGAAKASESKPAETKAKSSEPKARPKGAKARSGSSKS